MLKRFAKAICQKLIKINWLNREWEAYKIEREKRRIERHLEQRKHRTQAIVTDKEVVVDYMDGRLVGQRHVVPRVVRPFGMREDKF